MLHSMHLVPSPTIIDIDVRDDGEVLKPLVARLTSSPDLPVLLIGGKPVGSIADIREMFESGELKQRILQAGAVVAHPKRKKHH
jgi:glutaredoxin-related protein